MKIENSSFTTISTQVHTLDLDQLETLFKVYLYLDYDYNFFMSKETHESFMNIYFETFTKHQPNTFKSLINLLTSYTTESRYPDLLNTIDMIKTNYPLIDILNTLASNR